MNAEQLAELVVQARADAALRIIGGDGFAEQVFNGKVVKVLIVAGFRNLGGRRKPAVRFYVNGKAVAKDKVLEVVNA